MRALDTNSTCEKSVCRNEQKNEVNALRKNEVNALRKNEVNALRKMVMGINR